MLDIDNIVIESYRDKKTLNYLIKVLGEKKIIETLNSFKGNKRLYVSNIAKYNRIDIPDHIYHETADKESVSKILSDLKKKLRN